MKKSSVIVMMMSFGLLALVALPAVAHDPIPDSSACSGICDPGTPDPNICMHTPMPPDPGSECLEGESELPCDVIWPLVSFAGMPSWDLLYYLHPDMVIAEVEPFTIDLPAAGTYDFCGWMDQLYCGLDPVAGFAAEIEQFGYIIQCQNMDINGPVDDCLEIPMTSNGIPDRFELAVLAEVLNDPASPMNAQATAALQSNMDALVPPLCDALRAVDVGLQDPVDIRAILYAAAPWALPALGGIICAAATMGDDPTLAALDELVGLLADLGIEPPVITWQTVPALSADGDASANGFTNRELYDWLIQVNPAMTHQEFGAAALNPASRPPAKVTVQGGGSAYVDDDVTLAVNVSDLASGASAAAYQWYIWDVVGQECGKWIGEEGEQTCDRWCDVYDWVVIPDATGATLPLGAVTIEDSGKYGVGVDIDTGKAVEGAIIASTTLVVTEDPGMPVGSAVGLTLLAGACALAGAIGIRRRK